MEDSNRRNVLKAVGSTGILLGLGVGTATAKGKGKREGASAEKNIVETAQGVPELSTLVAAVVKADLVDILSGNRQLTVFAPTNDAFAAAGITSLAGLSKADLVPILTYHVTPGRRYASSVLNAPQLPTLNGAKIAVDGTELNDGQAVIDANNVDTEASNGVVHFIEDGVLLP